MQKTKPVQIIFCILLCILFLWEHIARLNNIKVRPSVGIDRLTTKSKIVFTEIGRMIAKISSFFTYIDITDLLDTLSILAYSLLELISSPLGIVKGYILVAFSYYNPLTYILGSMTLVTIILSGIKIIHMKKNKLNLVQLNR